MQETLQLMLQALPEGCPGSSNSIQLGGILSEPRKTHNINIKKKTVKHGAGHLVLDSWRLLDTRFDSEEAVGSNNTSGSFDQFWISIKLVYMTIYVCVYRDSNPCIDAYTYTYICIYIITNIINLRNI